MKEDLVLLGRFAVVTLLAIGAFAALGIAVRIFRVLAGI